MKKNYFTLVLIALFGITHAQTKSSGTVTLTTGFTLKIDVNNTTNLATFTMTGPTTAWFAVALDAQSMSSANSDCIAFGTSLLDRSLTGSQGQPTTDITQNLTVVTNTTSGSTRTLVFTRPLNTGDTKDYTFNYATLSSLSIIWAVGPNTTLSNYHASRGSSSLTFTVLGNEDFSPSLEKIALYPNPTNGILHINKNGALEINTIKVFNTNAQLIREIKVDNSSEQISINLTDLSKGIYFIEISNHEDKVVKQIELE